jgi:hypothetical protein
VSTQVNEAMAQKKQEWTAEITVEGHSPVYAWVAYNKQFDTFATATKDHARTFATKEDVERWIERLKVKNAQPIRC